MNDLFYGLEVDVSEAGFYERLDETREIFAKEIPEDSFEKLKTSESIHRYCGVFRKFFDDLLGDGSASNFSFTIFFHLFPVLNPAPLAIFHHIESLINQLSHLIH